MRSPQFLIDEHQDGYIQDRAWVEVTATTGNPAAAIKLLQSEMPIEDQYPDDEHHYEVWGVSWQREFGYPVEGQEWTKSEHPLEEYGDCAFCRGSGKVQVIDEVEWTDASLDRHRLRWLGAEVTDRTERKLGEVGGTIKRSHEEECSSCYGTGKAADWIHVDDGVPWESCKPSDDGATLFWCVHVHDGPPPEPAPVVSEDQETMNI